MTRPAPTSTVSGVYSRSGRVSAGPASSATDAREMSKMVPSVNRPVYSDVTESPSAIITRS